MSQTEALNGARFRLRVGPRIIGYASGVDGGETVAYEEVHVLGSLLVQEHVPVSYSATFEAEIIRVLGRSMKALGIFPTSDPDTNILTSGELSASLEDRVTGQVMANFLRVKASTKPFSVAARGGLVAERVGFVCIRVKDEFEVPLAAA